MYGTVQICLFHRKCIFMIKCDLIVAVGLVLVVLPITQQEELMGWFLEGHKFISFFITVTCLPSLNKGVTLPYLKPLDSY